MIAHTSCELLPHIFTLALLAPPRHEVERGLGGEVIFCGTVCSLLLMKTPTTADPALHRCIALCCPDFPTQPEALSR